ncbi:MAG: hypothetical protein H8E32_13365 [Nitrospinae bacterium]|nr:hypothetical protein [Nitrospinota bacterium]
MNFASISKLIKSREKRFAPFFLIFIFTLMAGFSPGLHNHEFDLDGPHQDCSPCQFAQINADVNEFSSNIFSALIVQIYKIRLTLAYMVKLSWTFSGLSPPL